MVLEGERLAQPVIFFFFPKTISEKFTCEKKNGCNEPKPLYKISIDTYIVWFHFPSDFKGLCLSTVQAHATVQPLLLT